MRVINELPVLNPLPGSNPVLLAIMEPPFASTVNPDTRFLFNLSVTNFYYILLWSNVCVPSLQIHMLKSSLLS